MGLKVVEPQSSMCQDIRILIIEFGKDAEKYFMDPLKVQTSCLVIIAELYRAQSTGCKNQAIVELKSLSFVQILLRLG